MQCSNVHKSDAGSIQVDELNAYSIWVKLIDRQTAVRDEGTSIDFCVGSKGYRSIFQIQNQLSLPPLKLPIADCRLQAKIHERRMKKRQRNASSERSDQQWQHFCPKRSKVEIDETCSHIGSHVPKYMSHTINACFDGRCFCECHRRIEP